MEKSKFVVVAGHPETGEAFTPSTKNSEWGTVRVDTPKQIVIENGIMDSRKRSAFIRMKKEFYEENKETLKVGDRLPGTVIYKNSTFPQYEGHEPKINPTTKETITDEAGNSVYMTAHYVSDPNAEDEYLVSKETQLSETEKKETQSL